MGGVTLGGIGGSVSNRRGYSFDLVVEGENLGKYTLRCVVVKNVSTGR